MTHRDDRYATKAQLMRLAAEYPDRVATDAHGRTYILSYASDAYTVLSTASPDRSIDAYVVMQRTRDEDYAPGTPMPEGTQPPVLDTVVRIGVTRRHMLLQKSELSPSPPPRVASPEKGPFLGLPAAEIAVLREAHETVAPAAAAAMTRQPFAPEETAYDRAIKPARPYVSRIKPAPERVGVETQTIVTPAVPAPVADYWFSAPRRVVRSMAVDEVWFRDAYGDRHVNTARVRLRLID